MEIGTARRAGGAFRAHRVSQRPMRQPQRSAARMRAAADARSCNNVARRAGLRGAGPARCGGGRGRPPVRQVNTVLMTNAAFCGSARKRTRPCEHSTMSTARRGAQRRVSSCVVTRHSAKPSGAASAARCEYRAHAVRSKPCRMATRKLRAGARSQGVQRRSDAAEPQHERVLSERSVAAAAAARAPVNDTSTATTTKAHSRRSVRRVFQNSRVNCIGAAENPGSRSVTPVLAAAIAPACGRARAPAAATRLRRTERDRVSRRAARRRAPLAAQTRTSLALASVSPRAHGGGDAAGVAPGAALRPA